jgi:predicted metal-dependent TIM-barrel fold hydrolase
MIVNGSVDSSGSKPLFLSAIAIMMRKSAFSAKDIRKTACDNLSDFIEAAPHFDLIS